MVLWALRNAFGGEIFIPKIPSFKVIDLAEAVSPNSKKEIVGIRFGEKIHEDLITSSESLSTIDIGQYYAILPHPDNLIDKYNHRFEICKKVNPGFSYNSETNDSFLNIKEIRNLIKENIDENFQPL